MGSRDEQQGFETLLHGSRRLTRGSATLRAESVRLRRDARRVVRLGNMPVKGPRPALQVRQELATVAQYTALEFIER